MEIAYKNMSSHYVFPKVQELQTQLDSNLREAVTKVEHMPEQKAVSDFLANFQTEAQQHVTKEWWNLADMLIVRYNDQYFNFGPDSPWRPLPSETLLPGCKWLASSRTRFTQVG